MLSHLRILPALRTILLPKTRTIVSRRRPTTSSSLAPRAPSEISTLPQIISSDPNLLPSNPIDYTLQSEISGNDIQVLTVSLRPNQILRTESGGMLYMTPGVTMNTTSGGGLSTSFSRYITGGSVFITDFSYVGEGEGKVCIGSDFPAMIEKIELFEYGGEITCQKGAMLAMGVDVDIEPKFSPSIKGGLFGGEGFIMQKLTSLSVQTDPHVFITGSGQLMKLPLKPNEDLRISTGALVAYTSSTCTFDVETLSGVKNVLFGGQGLFVTKITNTSNELGYVWVQGLESGRFVASIGKRLGVSGAGGMGGMGIPLILPGMGGSGGGENGGEAAGGVVGSAAGTGAGAEGIVGSGSGSGEGLGAMDAMDASSTAEAASSEALFGDAAPDSMDSTSTSFDSSGSGESGSGSVTDDFSEMMEDGTSFESEGDGIGEAVKEDGLLGKLWDMFNGSD